MVLGIIGKIGSGKSTCINYIKETYSAIVFNCDEIAKELIDNKEVVYEKVEGADFFTNENLQELCRQKLHPQVFSRISSEIRNIKNKTNFNNFSEQIVLIETALPSQMLYDMCDKVILIESSFEDKAKWLFDNRNYDIGKTKIILDSQKYYEKYYDMADYKIINDGDLNSFRNKIKEVIDEICVAGK